MTSEVLTFPAKPTLPANDIKTENTPTQGDVLTWITDKWAAGAGGSGSGPTLLIPTIHNSTVTEHRAYQAIVLRNDTLVQMAGAFSLKHSGVLTEEPIIMDLPIACSNWIPGMNQFTGTVTATIDSGAAGAAGTVSVAQSDTTNRIVFRITGGAAGPAVNYTQVKYNISYLTTVAAGLPESLERGPPLIDFTSLSTISEPPTLTGSTVHRITSQEPVAYTYLAVVQRNSSATPPYDVSPAETIHNRIDIYKIDGTGVYVLHSFIPADTLSTQGYYPAEFVAQDRTNLYQLVPSAWHTLDLYAGMWLQHTSGAVTDEKMILGSLTNSVVKTSNITRVPGYPFSTTEGRYRIMQYDEVSGFEVIAGVHYVDFVGNIPAGLLKLNTQVFFQNETVGGNTRGITSMVGNRLNLGDTAWNGTTPEIGDPLIIAVGMITDTFGVVGNVLALPGPYVGGAESVLKVNDGSAGAGVTSTVVPTEVSAGNIILPDITITSDHTVLNYGPEHANKIVSLTANNLGNVLVSIERESDSRSVIWYADASPAGECTDSTTVAKTVSVADRKEAQFISVDSPNIILGNAGSASGMGTYHPQIVTMAGTTPTYHNLDGVRFDMATDTVSVIGYGSGNDEGFIVDVTPDANNTLPVWSDVVKVGDTAVVPLGTRFRNAGMNAKSSALCTTTVDTVTSDLHIEISVAQIGVNSSSSMNDIQFGLFSDIEDNGRHLSISTQAGTVYPTFNILTPEYIAGDPKLGTPTRMSLDLVPAANTITLAVSYADGSAETKTFPIPAGVYRVGVRMFSSNMDPSDVETVVDAIYGASSMRHPGSGHDINGNVYPAVPDRQLLEVKVGKDAGTASWGVPISYMYDIADAVDLFKQIDPAGLTLIRAEGINDTKENPALYMLHVYGRESLDEPFTESRKIIIDPVHTDLDDGAVYYAWLPMQIVLGRYLIAAMSATGTGEHPVDIQDRDQKYIVYELNFTTGTSTVLAFDTWQNAGGKASYTMSSSVGTKAGEPVNFMFTSTTSGMSGGAAAPLHIQHFRGALME